MYKPDKSSTTMAFRHPIGEAGYFSSKIFFTMLKNLDSLCSPKKRRKNNVSQGCHTIAAHQSADYTGNSPSPENHTCSGHHPKATLAPFLRQVDSFLCTRGNNLLLRHVQNAFHLIPPCFFVLVRPCFPRKIPSGQLPVRCARRVRLSPARWRREMKPHTTSYSLRLPQEPHRMPPRVC